MLKQTLLVLALSALSAAVLAADYDPYIDIPFKRIKTSVSAANCFQMEL